MLIENSKKIVLKLGSTTVVDNKGIFKKKWVISLIKDIKKYGKGKSFVIVSSGAIALGQKYLKIKKKKIFYNLKNYRNSDILYGENKKLKEIGWVPKKNINTIIRDFIQKN